MSIGPEEARDMLQGIDDMTSRTKKTIAFGGGDILFIVWGIIWFIGGIGTHIMPILTANHPMGGARTGILTSALWIVLVVTGIAISCRVGKNAMPTRSPLAKSFSLMWWLLYLYVNLWIGLLMPFVKVDNQSAHLFWTHMGAIAATVPMFGYVMFGLFFDRYMLYIGLGMTALMAVGVFFVEPWFYLWMAFVGGGGLIGTGLMIRKLWKRQ